MAKTGPAQGSTLRNKDAQEHDERGGMRNQCPKATKLANSRKKKSSTARLTLMYNYVTNQATIDTHPLLCTTPVSLKTRAPHPLKFIPLQPSHLYLTCANTATVSDYSF